MIREKLEKRDSNGYIFDGFPRNLEQAKALDEILYDLRLSLDLVVEIVVKDD
jgi:adenylate kinase